jgi:hypothetical protein
MQMEIMEHDIKRWRRLVEADENIKFPSEAAKAEIADIMDTAFDRAATVLGKEVSRFLQANRDKYSRFVLAVGWGPTLFDINDHVVQEGPDLDRDPVAKRLMHYATDFYDRYGADNRQFTAGES